MPETTKFTEIDTTVSIVAPTVKYFINTLEQHIDRSKYKHIELVLGDADCYSIKIVSTSIIILEITSNLTYKIKIRSSLTDSIQNYFTYLCDSGSLADPDSCQKIIRKISELLDSLANGMQSADVSAFGQLIQYTPPVTNTIRRSATLR